MKKHEMNKEFQKLSKKTRKFHKIN